MHAALVPEHAAEGPLIGMAFAVSAVCYLLSRTTGIPTSALGVAVHALTLLIEQRLIGEVARYAGAATIRVLPPLCPLAVSAADFSQGERLVERGRLASLEWLAAGGSTCPSRSGSWACTTTPRTAPGDDAGTRWAEPPTVLGRTGEVGTMAARRRRSRRAP